MELELTSISSIRLSIYPDRMCDIHATGSWQYPNGQITNTTTQATCIRALVRVLRKTNRLVTLILSTSNDSREPQPQDRIDAYTAVDALSTFSHIRALCAGRLWYNWNEAAVDLLCHILYTFPHLASLSLSPVQPPATELHLVSSDIKSSIRAIFMSITHPSHVAAFVALSTVATHVKIDISDSCIPLLAAHTFPSVKALCIMFLESGDHVTHALSSFPSIKSIRTNHLDLIPVGWRPSVKVLRFSEKFRTPFSPFTTDLTTVRLCDFSHKTTLGHLIAAFFLATFRTASLTDPLVVDRIPRHLGSVTAQFRCLLSDIMNL